MRFADSLLMGSQHVCDVTSGEVCNLKKEKEILSGVLGPSVSLSFQRPTTLPLQTPKPNGLTCQTGSSKVACERLPHTLTDQSVILLSVSIYLDDLPFFTHQHRHHKRVSQLWHLKRNAVQSLVVTSAHARRDAAPPIPPPTPKSEQQ